MTSENKRPRTPTLLTDDELPHTPKKARVAPVCPGAPQKLKTALKPVIIEDVPVPRELFL
jgi:hypothetical protein